MFKLGYNTEEAIKNICCAKGEGTFDHWRFKNFCLDCKNLNDQAKLDGLQTVDS